MKGLQYRLYSQGLAKMVAKKLKIAQVCQLVAKNVCLTGKALAMSSNLDHTHTGCSLMLLCERATVQSGPSEKDREKIEG